MPVFPHRSRPGRSKYDDMTHEARFRPACCGKLVLSINVKAASELFACIALHTHWMSCNVGGPHPYPNDRHSPLRDTGRRPSVTTNQEAIIRLFRVVNRYVGQTLRPGADR